jgi:cytochrome c5
LSDQDNKIVDLILLTIGILIAVAVALFVISRNMGNETMTHMQMNDPEIQAAINKRIEPLGQLVLDGETVADEAEVAAVVGAEAAPALLTGPQVYNAACMACHGGGIAGAPKTGDAAVWAPRIAQGMDTLNTNALNGLQGSAGFMPPKGGRADLSDEEIIAAVQYLVDQAN